MSIRFVTSSVLVALCAIGAAAAATFTALPGPFELRNPPVVWEARGPDSLSITAGPQSNWFVTPWDAKAIDSAPTLLLRPDGDFSLSAKVALEPKKRWDSGALALYVDKDHWAKLCLENARGDGTLSVVMVVTGGISDDSYTNFTAPDNALYLKVTRKGTAFYFDASQDGKSWTMFRAFTLGGDLTALRTGLLAQSPVGDGMIVNFSEIRYAPLR